MRHIPERHIDAADLTVKNIRRKTRNTSEDKIRIVLASLRSEEMIAEFRRQETIKLAWLLRPCPGGHGPEIADNQTAELITKRL